MKNSGSSQSFFGYILSTAAAASERGLAWYEKTFLPSGIRLQSKIDKAIAEAEAAEAIRKNTAAKP